jgi:protein-S-isoprenylcysteine O-methyltransferase Ste14
MSNQIQKAPSWMLVVAIFYVLIFPALLLLLAGDWLWIEGWIFTAWFLGLCYTAIVYLYKKDPTLLQERYQQPGTLNQEGWDRYMVYLLVFGFVLWIIVMPLDARRFHWSPGFPWWLKGFGVLILMASAFLIFRSYVDNPYLSPLVRIQEERDQRVVSTGVYGFVRHPMYLGGVLLFIGVPLLLGSIVGLAVGLALILLVARRIKGEEELLSEELDGYAAYMHNVKFRLIPYIW